MFGGHYLVYWGEVRVETHSVGLVIGVMTGWLTISWGVFLDLLLVLCGEFSSDVLD